jgi:TP901 family phage tail tape measure protein
VDATLTIQVRVLGAQAQQQIKALQSQLNALNTQSAASTATSAAGASALGTLWTQTYQNVGKAWSGLRAAWANGTNNFNRTIRSLDRAGQSLRRSGQQIAFGFTLPLTLAGAAILNWAMDNERAMTQVKKVYGDASYGTERIKAETDALAKTFELLSSVFGVHQDQVINIAGEWAAAGLAGEDLARATRATMEAMMLGDLDSERATKSLISIMATWRTSLDDMGNGFSELTDAMAILNSVENQTGARFADLIDAFDRAGGAARQAGMSMVELSALVAALVPATGSGAAAGNAIKTLVSRIMAPTNETIEVLNAIGITTNDPEWMGATATQKIERMAREFESLDQATKNVVTSTVAGRWQLNRFEVMMADIASGTGMYAKALKAGSDATKRQGDYLKELDAIMESNPKKMDILTNVLRNELSTAMIQFIPIILGVLNVFGKLAQGFNNLPPQTKRWIVLIIALIAVLGPLLMLLGVLTTTMKFVFEAIGFFIGVLHVAWSALGIFGNMLGWVATTALPLLKVAIWRAAAQIMIAFRYIQLTWVGTAAQMVRQGAIMVGTWIGMAGSAVMTAGKVALAWLGTAAKGVASAALQMVKSFGTLLVSFALTAVSAARSAGVVGIMWLQSAAPGLTAAVIAMVGSMRTMITVSAMMAAASVRSALVTLTAWAVMAAPGIVSAIGAIGAAIGAAAAAIGVPTAVLVAAIAAAVGFIAFLFNRDFRDAIGNAIEWVARGIWGLPKVFASALSALMRVVAKAISKIVDWLSYLNPFQRHSPSLVDNVKAGVATILDEYSRLRGISAVVKSAAAAHQEFQNAIAGAQGAMDAQETAEQRQVIARQAPNAVGAFDNMVAQRSALNAQLPPIAQQIAAQAAVVGPLQARYDELDRSVTVATRTLEDLQYQLDSVNASMDASQEAIDRYANTGITGMRAMSDSIFENTMAQKRLKLAIMDLEDAGGALDDLKSRMEALNGEMEMLTGVRNGLYMAGAGSDILSVYDAQIDAVRAQQEGISDNVTELERMNAELERLQRTGERLDLENSINFDPQLRQIEQLADGLEELPFEEIIANIQREQASMAALAPLQQSLNVKVDQQRSTLDAITWQRDLIKRQLDDEQAKLDDLEAAYRDIESLISDMTSSMQDFASASERAQSAAKAANEGPLDGLSGDYDIQGGSAVFDTESSLAGIEEINRQLEQELAGILDDMPDPFKTLREKWDQVVGWIQESWLGDVAGWLGRNLSLEGLGNIASEVGGFFQRNFSLEGLKNIGSEILGFFLNIGGMLLNILLWPFRQMANLLRPIWQPVWSIISTVFSIIVTIVTTAWNVISAVFTWAWQNVIYPVLMALWNFFYTYIFPVFQLLAGIVQIVFTVVYRIIEFAVKVVIAILMGLWWVITHVGDVVMWLWNNAVKPVFNWIKDLIKQAWEVFIRPALDGLRGFVKDKLGPAMSWLWEEIIKPVWEHIKGAVKGAWDAIRPAFEAMKGWLEDNLPKAWNVLKDAVTGVFDFLKTGAETWANAIVAAVNIGIKAFNKLSGGVKAVGSALGIDITINEIPEIDKVKLAKGGIPPVDSNGGLYAGVRAIVGEGSRVWPEYVIPTDPKYRDRAKMLAQAAAERVGLFARGGAVGQGDHDQSLFDRARSAASSLIGSGMDVVKGAAREGAKLAFAPVKALMNALIDTIPSEFIKGIARKPITMIEDWIKNADPKIKGDRGTLEGWKGRPGSFVALMKYFDSTGVPGHAISTIRPGATTRGSGNTRASLHASARAVDYGTRPMSVDSDGLLAIYRAFLPVRDLLTELIYSGPGGSNPRNPITAADHHNHVHVGLARGGVLGQTVHQFANGGRFTVPRVPGGVLARIGEGFYDEEVQIKPIRNSDFDGGGDTYNFFGDLSFPNITDPDDAEKFIENLKAMADT